VREVEELLDHIHDNDLTVSALVECLDQLIGRGLYGLHLAL